MALSKSKIFLILCLSFIVGVFAGRFLNYETMAVLAMVFIIAATIGWGNKTAMVVGFAGLVLLAGGLRFKLVYNQNDLAPFYGSKVSGSGVVSEEPDLRSGKTYLTLSQLTINQKAVSSKLLLSVSRFPEYQYGQKLNFEAKIVEPKDDAEFSYKNYLSRYGIGAVAYQPKITVIPGMFGNPIKMQILRLKEKFTENISKILPEPQNSFLAGLLLGAKRAIPAELMDKFNATGTSHIVAVSGYNITIIAAGISELLVWFGLRKRMSFILSLIAIIVFVIMTGASASVIRAGIMGALLLIALNIGRLNAITNSLAFTAAIMLVVNPEILHFDIGFQLSFLALMGLVYFIPLLEQFFLWLSKIIREILLATLAAQIFTLPILLFNFGRLSLVAPFANILTLLVVPITMFFGFFAGLLGLIWAPLALPLTWITWLLLTYIIKVVEFFSSLPLAALNWHTGLVFVIAYYIILCFLLFYHYKKDFIINFLTKWKAKPENSFGA